MSVPQDADRLAAELLDEEPAAEVVVCAPPLLDLAKEDLLLQAVEQHERRRDEVLAARQHTARKTQGGERTWGMGPVCTPAAVVRPMGAARSSFQNGRSTTLSAPALLS